jgi:NAD-dependent deacetylase
MDAVAIDEDTRVLVLTGAGVSAESGIPTFRGTSGLWESHPVEKVASLDGFLEDPALVWRFYSERRAAASKALPNAGHAALASLEARLGDRFLLATQNVDGLHAMAGSERVVEMHGSLWKTRCTRCARPPFEDRATYDAQHLPACGRCHEKGELALLRPHIVWFGERLDPAHLARIAAFSEAARGHRFVFLAVGTSGRVSPASELVLHAKARGAETWLVNLEAPDNVDAFDHVLSGPSGEVLPQLLG